ncbi:MAG TPA: guanylate kinase [Firmicutes bacterium]|nr:guanylate kinase [Bacillota bacterium]
MNVLDHESRPGGPGHGECKGTVLKRKSGFLVVLSGPSGVGKNTVVNEVLRRVPGLRYSVSVTTRSPRPGEVDGTNYYFVSDEKFRMMCEAGEFLEWARVYGHYYGTPRRYIEEAVTTGWDVILDIDIQGAMQIRRSWPSAVFIFLLPPSLSELERRMIERGVGDPGTKRLRLASAREELAAIKDYQYAVVNDRKEDAVEAIRCIIESERHKVERCECAEFIGRLRQSGD